MDHRFQNVFRSMVDGVNTPESVERIINFALKNQRNLLKKVFSPEREKLWNENELENMRIETDLIDLLFDVYCDDKIEYVRDYILIARMRKDNNSIYVALTGTEIVKDSYFGGYIIFTKESENFTDIIADHYKPHFIKRVSELIKEDEEWRTNMNKRKCIYYK